MAQSAENLLLRNLGADATAGLDAIADGRRPAIGRNDLVKFWLQEIAAGRMAVGRVTPDQAREFKIGDLDFSTSSDSNDLAAA